MFTTAGVHPYDEVTWESRDIVQTNWKTGETIFEQQATEFPEFWSAKPDRGHRKPSTPVTSAVDEPTDIAETVAFLAGPTRWVNGQVVCVNGGLA